MRSSSRASVPPCARATASAASARRSPAPSAKRSAITSRERAERERAVGARLDLERRIARDGVHDGLGEPREPRDARARRSTSIAAPSPPRRDAARRARAAAASRASARDCDRARARARCRPSSRAREQRQAVDQAAELLGRLDDEREVARVLALDRRRVARACARTRTPTRAACAGRGTRREICSGKLRGSSGTPRAYPVGPRSAAIVTSSSRRRSTSIMANITRAHRDHRQRGRPGLAAGRAPVAEQGRRDRPAPGHPHLPRRRRDPLLRRHRVLGRSRSRPEGRAHVALRGAVRRGDRVGRDRRRARDRGARGQHRDARARAPGIAALVRAHRGQVPRLAHDARHRACSRRRSTR